VDQQLKQLMKELGEAINESLSDSESIAEVRIAHQGRRLRHLPRSRSKPSASANRAKTRPTTPPWSPPRSLSTNAELKISDQDLKFLKSLRIKLDHEEEE